MNRVTSKDGTPIAYERGGSGPAIILVGGGLDDGSENATLVPELAKRFTVLNYARRGRGDSGDTLPYAVDREIEDLNALIGEAGGSAHLFGASSGGALVLEAAAAGVAVERLAVYEVPYATDDDAARYWSHYVTQLTTALSDGRRGEAIELFMQLAGSSADDIAKAHESPMWSHVEGLAHTLAYDAACLGDGRPPTTRLATITQPTLVATGGIVDPHMQGLQPGYFDAAADEITAALPNARRQILEKQTHVAEPRILASILEQFFTS
ncbi:alpha/beta fold hydrolase [Herbihabitans rhizosphaerae]|nr:alpha/beta hydrolase [Herbihabitans rhizosphaerae]